MDKQYKKNQSSLTVDTDHAALLLDSIQQEAQHQDDSHQRQVNLFDSQYNTVHREEPPHAPIDQSPHQHAPNHANHEHSNHPSNTQYLRDPDTGLWVNQVRSGR